MSFHSKEDRSIRQGGVRVRLSSLWSWSERMAPGVESRQECWMSTDIGHFSIPSNARGEVAWERVDGSVCVCVVERWTAMDWGGEWVWDDEDQLQTWSQNTLLDNRLGSRDEVKKHLRRFQEQQQQQASSNRNSNSVTLFTSMDNAFRTHKDLQARVGGQRSSLNSSTYQPLSLPSILILGIQWTGSNPILLPSQTQNSRSDQDTSSSVTSWWWADQVLWIIQSLNHSWVRTAQWDTSPPPRKKQAELGYRSQSTWWIESNSSQSKSHNTTVELRPVPHWLSLEIFSGSVLCGLVAKPLKNA